MIQPYYYKSRHSSRVVQKICYQNSCSRLNDLAPLTCDREIAYYEPSLKTYCEMILHVYWDGIVIQFVDYTISLRPELGLFYNGHLSVSNTV